MQRWFLALAVAAGCAGVASAQIEIQVQAQPAPVQVQVQVQGNVQVVQVQAADRIALMPGVVYNQNRLMQADAIVVGRVVAMEPMDIDASPSPGQANVKYRVTVVQVSEIIHGLAKDTKNVRVAFVMQPNNVPGGPGIQILPAQPAQPAIQPFPGRRPFIQQVNLQVGQDGMFALSKHHKEKFYLVPNYTNFIQRENNPGFENEVKTAKQLSKAMADPVAALKAEDKQDRYTAAAILITKYRSNPTGLPTKSEPISKEESKLILQALQGGDWTIGRFNAQIPNPFELFGQLNIGPNDGYKPIIRNQQDQATAMQKWLDENASKYVIQKLVTDPNAKVQAPNVDPALPVPPVVRPPIIVNPKIKVKAQPLPIKGNLKVQPLPAPAPAPIPIEIEVVPPQPAPVPLPIRREEK